MKTNQQTTLAAPDWTLAKSLLAELKSAVRRSLTLQILTGRELAAIKESLGFTHGSQERFSKWPNGHLEKTWGQWVDSELKISRRSADRWIACFQAAVSQARKKKSQFPDALALLEAEPANTSEPYLTLLSDQVHRLVDGMTQAGLLEELLLVKSAKPLTGGDTSQNRNVAQAAFEDIVKDLFSGITRGCGELARKIYGGRNRVEFHAVLEAIPLASEDPEAPSLYAIRASLRGIFDGELPKMIEAVEGRILEEENKANPAKPRRAKTTTTA